MYPYTSCIDVARLEAILKGKREREELNFDVEKRGGKKMRTKVPRSFFLLYFPLSIYTYVRNEQQ